MLFLLLLASLSCESQPETTPENIIRLFPTEKILPLIEISITESSSLEKADETIQNNVFHRFNVNDVSRPGRLIPMGTSWVAQAEVRSPDRLSFSALFVPVVPADSGDAVVKVSIRQSGRLAVEHEFPMAGFGLAHPEWNDLEVDLGILENGVTEFSFECISDSVESSTGKTGFLLIGAPMIVPEIQKRDKPNVIMIVVDTLRADHLGCWGSPDPISPVLDGISKNTDRFISTIACSSWTKPAMNSILTGLYPTRNKLLGATFSKFGEDVPVLAEKLAGSGFYTIGISSNMLITPISEYDRGFDFFDTRPVLPGTTNSTDQMLDHIRIALPADQIRPFFMLAHIMDPHDLYIAPPPYNSLYPGSESSSSFRESVRIGHASQANNDFIAGETLPITELETNHLRARYRGEIRYVDRMLGILFRDILTRYPDDEFVFFILSDHGEGFMEHGSLSHGKNLYQESIHVPWMIWQPGTTKKNRIYVDNASQADVFITMMKMLDLPHPATTDGIDVFGSEKKTPRTIFSFLANQRDLETVWRVALSGERKMVKVRERKDEIFDLGTDPSERRPIPVESNDPLSGKLDEMMRLEKYDRGSDSSPKKVLEQLRSLGYIK